MFAEINLTEEAQIFSSVKLDFKIFKNFFNSKFRWYFFLIFKIEI